MFLVARPIAKQTRLEKDLSGLLANSTQGLCPQTLFLERGLLLLLGCVVVYPVEEGVLGHVAVVGAQERCTLAYQAILLS